MAGPDQKLHEPEVLPSEGPWADYLDYRPWSTDPTERARQLNRMSEKNVDEMRRRWNGHPQYRGKTCWEVHNAVDHEIRVAQYRYACLSTIPDRSPKEAAALLELNDRYIEFGGPEWTSADPGPVVRRIVAFEAVRDEAGRMMSIDEYRANKARFARYGPETNLQAWWHDHSLTVTIGIIVLIAGVILIF